MNLIATASRLPMERSIALVGATLLIGTSAALGATYGFQLGARQHVALGVLFAAAALGGELLKPIAVAVGIGAARAWQPLRALACLTVAAVCVVYSVAGELSIAAGARGDVAADRGASAERVARAKDRYEAARTELLALPQARPVEELRMLVSGVLAHPKAVAAASCWTAPTRALSAPRWSRGERSWQEPSGGSPCSTRWTGLRPR